METKKDYIDLDTRSGAGLDAERKFGKILREKSQEYTIARKPFCMACAHQDFNDQVSSLRKELMRRTKEMVGNEKELNQINLALEKYGDLNIFKLKGERIIRENRLVNGTKLSVPVYFADYICIKRGHGCSIEMEQDEYNRWKSGKSKK